MYTANRECRTCRYCGYPSKGCMAQGGKPRYLAETGCPRYAMSAKAYMERVMGSQRRIVHMEEQAAHYRDMATGVGASCSFAAVRGSGFAESAMEKNVNALMLISDEIGQEIERLRTYMREVKEMIFHLPDPRERELLEMRYLSGMKWGEISLQMLLDERHVRRLHEKALQHVQRDMDLIEYAKSRPEFHAGGANTQSVQ